jgi:hypothetical protein
VAAIVVSDSCWPENNLLTTIEQNGVVSRADRMFYFLSSIIIVYSCKPGHKYISMAVMVRSICDVPAVLGLKAVVVS